MIKTIDSEHKLAQRNILECMYALSGCRESKEWVK